MRRFFVLRATCSKFALIGAWSSTFAGESQHLQISNQSGYVAKKACLLSKSGQNQIFNRLRI
jgi:hypothetical protein